MANSITEDGLRHYCNEIKTHAMAVCQISYDNLVLEPIKEGTEVNINFELRTIQNGLILDKSFQICSNLFPFQQNQYLELFLLETDKRMN